MAKFAHKFITSEDQASIWCKGMLVQTAPHAQGQVKQDIQIIPYHAVHAAPETIQFIQEEF
jgi:hypothetical protein